MIQIDSDQLLRLFKDFYSLTKIKICLFDEDQSELLYYPERFNPYCEFIHGSPAADTCKNSDAYAFKKCRETRSVYIYKCPMGLTEAIAPIFHNDTVVGFIMIGQVRGDEEIDSPRLESISKEYNLDGKRLLSLYENIRPAHFENILAAAHILEACAGYLYLKRLVQANTESLHAKLEKYISENLSSDLPVERLCSEFRLSRTELYRYFDDLYGMSVAQYIKKRRLRYAADLVKTTKLSNMKICDRAGFSDYNYFTKMFKKEFGLSPRNYMKSFKGKQPFTP
jgi:AraC-like DNA-binding protein